MSYGSKRAISKAAKEKAKEPSQKDLQTIRTNVAGPERPFAQALDMITKAKALIRATGGKAGSSAGRTKAKTGRVLGQRPF